MQELVKNQKTLIGCIGLVILGTGNAQAISSLDGQRIIQPSISNILPGLAVSDSIAQKNYVNYINGDRIAIANSLPALRKAVGQSAAMEVGLGVLNGRISEVTSIESPLLANVHLYGDVLDAAVHDGLMNSGKDGFSTLIAFHADGAVSNMPSAKVPMDGNMEASPVPLPAAAWSFLLGLLGILGLKKRKNPPSETIL